MLLFSVAAQQVLADKVRMDSTLLHCIAVHLDERTLRDFSFTCKELLLSVASLLKDQHFFYLRTQALVSLELENRTGVIWSDVHKTLSLALSKKYNSLLRTLDCPFSTSVLLKMGYDPLEKDQIAFRTAVDNHKVETVKVFLSDGRVNWGAYDPVIGLLVHYDEAEVLSSLIPEMDYSNGWSLGQAAEEGASECLKLLLQHPEADPTSVCYGWSEDVDLLDIAIMSNHIESMRVLLEDGRCDPSKNNNKLLKSSREWDYAEMIALLLTDPRVQRSL